MTYILTVPVHCGCPRSRVYGALVNLKTHPLWNSGMTRISDDGVMYEGMHYEVETAVMGQTSRHDVEVVRLVPDKLVGLFNDSGMVRFQLEYRLADAPDGGTDVTCSFNFQLHNFVLNLGRAAIEEMAETRMRSDLETLCTILCDGGQVI
jgi:uncharacterized protein YndB with AHSA1/START domain